MKKYRKECKSSEVTMHSFMLQRLLILCLLLVFPFSLLSIQVHFFFFFDELLPHFVDFLFFRFGPSTKVSFVILFVAKNCLHFKQEMLQVILFFWIVAQDLNIWNLIVFNCNTLIVDLVVVEIGFDMHTLVCEILILSFRPDKSITEVYSEDLAHQVIDIESKAFATTRGHAKVISSL